MKIIAHRGSCKQGGIENTYSSFKKAVEQKADRIEHTKRKIKEILRKKDLWRLLMLITVKHWVH